MRKIRTIVVHCSATIEGKPFNAAAIDAMHRARGFNKIGYHFVVGLDGTVEEGRRVSEVGAHVSGHNADSIGVCYIGGLDAKGGAKDTRTGPQRAAMRNLMRWLLLKFPDARVVGHRELSPDRNRDGKITSDEFIKQCPCFDAGSEYQGVRSDTAKGGALRIVTKDVPRHEAGADYVPASSVGTATDASTGAGKAA